MPVLVVGGLGAVGIAVVALLLAVAAIYLARFIAGLIPSDLPVIGSRLHDVIINLTTYAIYGIHALLDSAVQPLMKVLAYPVTALTHLWDVAVASFTDLISVVAYIRHWAIPFAMRAAQAYAARLVAAAKAALTVAIEHTRAMLAAGLAAARSYAAGLVAAAIHQLTLALALAKAALVVAIDHTRALLAASIAATRSYARGLVAVAVTELHAAIGVVDHFARHAYADTLGRLAALGISLEHFATAAAAAATAESTAILNAGIHAGLSDVWPAITSEVDVLAAGIAVDFPDILTGIKAIPRAIPTDAAAAITATAAISIPMLRYLEKCGLRNCRNLGGLGNALHELEALIGGGALLAFVIEAAHNPGGIAGEIHDELEPVVGGLANGFLDLIGLR